MCGYVLLPSSPHTLALLPPRTRPVRTEDGGQRTEPAVSGGALGRSGRSGSRLTPSLGGNPRLGDALGCVVGRQAPELSGLVLPARLPGKRTPRLRRTSSCGRESVTATRVFVLRCSTSASLALQPNSGLSADPSGPEVARFPACPRPPPPPSSGRGAASLPPVTQLRVPSAAGASTQVPAQCAPSTRVCSPLSPPPPSHRLPLRRPLSHHSVPGEGPPPALLQPSAPRTRSFRPRPARLLGLCMEVVAVAGGRGPRHAPSLTAGPAQDGPHFRSPWRKKAPLRSGGRVPGSQRTPVSARHPLAPSAQRHGPGPSCTRPCLPRSTR